MMQVLWVTLAVLAAVAVIAMLWWIKRLDRDTADMFGPDTLTDEERRKLQIGIGIGLSGGTGSIMGGG